MKLNLIFIALSLVSPSWFGTTAAAAGREVLVEAESFAQPGGWVVDQQSMDQMGSPYLLAHGLGLPVKDATTAVEFPQAGRYRLWVRTRDWVAPWKTPDTHPDMKAEGTPGIFQVLVDGKAVPVTFGTEGAEWHWQDGGVVEVAQKTVTLALHDLTGFAGRCDALLFTASDGAAPPHNPATLAPLRLKLRGLPEAPLDAGEYDLVVVGGGAAGCCAAVSAARLGCKVALLHDRPVLGGNNSSEVRVGLSGLIHQQPYPRLGDLVDEWGPVGHWNLYQAKKAPALPRSKEVMAIMEQHLEKKIHNAGPASNYEDEQKLAVVQAEKNLTLFLSTRANGVEMAGKRIAAVMAEDIKTGVKRKFRARLVADCTGDGVIGALAGADFAYGRESKDEFGEDTAPQQKDELVMGTSVQWFAEADEQPSTFPECPWALPLNEKTCVKTTRGDWDWETGATRNHVTEIEQIRDYGLRVVYGNWAVLKNHPKFKAEFARQRLKWVAYIGGKRESRRLLGDVILRQQDIVEARPFPDASVTTTWTIDLHYPKESMCACEAFRSEARHIKIKPYPIPYRCLYSRNIENLMMAGRNISVTHVALGTVRVMRTTGMMGEVVGMAASLCTKHAATPRGVYEKHLDELKALMQRGVGKQGPTLLPPGWDPKAAADKVLSSMIQVTGPEVKGAHDADLTIVGDRACVVAIANDVKPGHGAGKDEYCTLSVVNLQRLQVERRIPLAKSAQAFANVTLPVGACFVPRILKLNDTTLRCFFACEDQNGTGGRQAQMWYRDFDSAALTFEPDIHRMKIKTAAGTFDMQPKYFHADAARQGFQNRSMGYGLYMIDSFKVFDGKTYAVINNFPGAQNALGVLNDQRDTVEVLGHYNEPADLRLTESAVNRLPDGTWLAICRAESGDRNYVFTTSKDGRTWTKGEPRPFVTKGSNSKPTFDKFNGVYYLGWQEATRITDGHGVGRYIFNVEVSRDGVDWERKYRFESTNSFQYPTFRLYDGTIWFTVTQGTGGSTDRIMFGKLEPSQP